MILFCRQVQFDGIDQRYQPGEKRLMRRMLRIRIQRCLVFELHDADEGVALSSRRDVGANVSLNKSGDLPLKRDYLSSSSFFLLFRGPWLPLKTKNVKGASSVLFRHRISLGSGKKRDGRGRQTACLHQCSPCHFVHPGSFLTLRGVNWHSNRQLLIKSSISVRVYAATVMPQRSRKQTASILAPMLRDSNTRSSRLP